MNNDVQYLSPFMFAAAILAVLSAAAVIRLISKTFSRRRALRHLRHDSGTDDEGKLLFKQKIRRCYMVEEHRNREKLKRQITKGIMLAQTYQFQKLRHTDITHIIRRTLLNFRYRFFYQPAAGAYSQSPQQERRHRRTDAYAADRHPGNDGRHGIKELQKAKPSCPGRSESRMAGTGGKNQGNEHRPGAQKSG